MRTDKCVLTGVTNTTPQNLRNAKRIVDDMGLAKTSVKVIDTGAETGSVWVRSQGDEFKSLQDFTRAMQLALGGKIVSYADTGDGEKIVELEVSRF